MMPYWFPNLNAWLSAVFLLLLTSGLGACVKAAWQMGNSLAHISPRLTILFGLLGLVCPIILIAFAHHLLHLFLDRFFPDSRSPEMTNGSSHPDPDQSNGVTPVAIATGLGWVLGGPLGAAVLGGASYVLNQMTDRSPEAVKEASHHSANDSTYSSTYNSENRSTDLNQIHSTVIQDYFNRLSATALAVLNQYEIAAQKILSLEIEEPPVPIALVQQHQLALLQSTLDLLHDEA